MPILKLKEDNPQKELEFEVRCNLAYSLEQRVHLLQTLSKRVLKMAGKYGNLRTTQVIKRPAS